MNIKSGETAPFTAFFEDATGAGVTGLTVTVDIYDPSRTKVVSDGAATEIGGGYYEYPYQVTAGPWRVTFKTVSTAVAAKHKPSMIMVSYAGVEHLDAA